MSTGLFLSSWPLALGSGSGTALFVNSIRQAVEQGGQALEIINPPLDTNDYAQFVYNRLWFNTQLPHDARLARADWVLTIDYDGYAVPRRASQPFVASARALFAEIAPTEPEPFRTLLNLQAFFDGHNFRAATWVTTASEYARQKVAEYHAVPMEKIKCIPNGINLPEWDGHWRAIPEPDAKRPPTVLAVSKLYPRKKIDTLIQAVPLLRQRFPDVQVRIVGGGFEWESWRKLAEDLHVAASLTWLGDVHDRRQVVAEYKRCHVFVHPSIQETFGNVLLEAMASSRPIVAAQAAALPETVQASGGGVVVPPEQPEALAHTIIELLENEVRRAQLGRHGREFAKQMTWERAAQQYQHLLTQTA